MPSRGDAVRPVATLLLTTLLLTALLAVGGSAAGEAGCSAATRLFAVAAGTRHLAELPYCAELGRSSPRPKWTVPTGGGIGTCLPRGTVRQPGCTR